MPEARLNICIPPTSTLKQDPDELEKFNILFKGSIPKKDLADLINTCRVLTYPGHVNETGCQVALQAIGLGIPIVSCGIGSLKDLVNQGETGFLETDKKQYADKVLQCLKDDQVWDSLHQGTLNHPWRQSYDQRVLDWEKIFLS